MYLFLIQDFNTTMTITFVFIKPSDEHNTTWHTDTIFQWVWRYLFPDLKRLSGEQHSRMWRRCLILKAAGKLRQYRVFHAFFMQSTRSETTCAPRLGRLTEETSSHNAKDTAFVTRRKIRSIVRETGSWKHTLCRYNSTDVQKGPNHLDIQSKSHPIHVLRMAYK